MISESLQQRKPRTRRSMLFVPGANAAMVSNSFIYPADALMFDWKTPSRCAKILLAVWCTTRCSIRCITTLKLSCA